MRRPTIAALLILAAVTAASAQDEPERVRRFDAPESAPSSLPFTWVRTPTTLYVGEGYASVDALWRIGADGGAPDVVASVPNPDLPPQGWFAGGGAIGESALITGPGGLWRVDPTGAPQLIEPGGGSVIGSARGVAFLAKSDDEHGTELWSTGGTFEGATRVFDLEPGPDSSTPSHGVTVGSTLFFFATTSAHGRELWRTDGTAEGTALVIDLVPGAMSPSGLFLGRLPGAVVVRGIDAEGVETLWRSDGTAEGTIALHQRSETYTGIGSGMEFGDVLLFTVREADFTNSLWRTDGTAEGTFELLDGSAWGLLTVAGDHAYISVREAEPSRVAHLWRTDGTVVGTELVKEFEATSWGGVAGARAFGDELVLTAITDADGASLWRSDGTEAGTHPIVTHADGVSVALPSGQPNDYYPGLFEVVGDAIYFSGRGAGGIQLFVSDGTPGDARLVPLSSPHTTAIREMETSDGSLFLAVDEAATGRELWVSDGTMDGTSVLTELTPGNGASGVSELTDMGAALWFVGAGEGAEFAAIHRATADAYTSLAEIRRGETPGGASRLHRIGDSVYFRAYFDYDDITAWVSDGTQDGTLELGGDSPYNFFDVNGSVLFFSRRGGNWTDLWRTDGTSIGTGRVHELTPPIGQTHLSNAVVVDDILYFGAAGSTDGDELWRSGGTGNTTYVEADLVPGEGHGSPEKLFAAGDRLYFVAHDAEGVDSLRMRTANGDIEVVWDGGGYRWADPEGVAVIGDELLFLANSEEHGRELWITDDSPAGAHLLRDIDAGSAFVPPREFVDVGGGKVVFVAYDVRHGTELWTTDGTSAGTVLLADLVSGPRGAQPHDLTVLGDDLFLAIDGAGASELVRVPLSLLDDVEEPTLLPAFEALPPLPPEGPEPAPISDLPVEPPDPEPLTVDVLKLRLDTQRTGRDRLRVKFRLPIACAALKDGVPLRVDVGGYVVDVELDARGRAKPQAGAHIRVRDVRPRRKKDAPTEVRVDIEIRRADLRTPLADEDLVLPAGERRIERDVRVVTSWCDVDYAETTSVRYKQRRGIGTAKLLRDD